MLLYLTISQQTTIFKYDLDSLIPDSLLQKKKSELQMLLWYRSYSNTQWWLLNDACCIKFFLLFVINCIPETSLLNVWFLDLSLSLQYFLSSLSSILQCDLLLVGQVHVCLLHTLYEWFFNNFKCLQFPILLDIFKM